MRAARANETGMVRIGLRLPLLLCGMLALAQSQPPELVLISTAAGTGSRGFGGDGGPAAAAALFSPSGVAAAGDGSLYIADRFNHRIRKVSPDGRIQTVAGSGTQDFRGDGGPATAASLNYPTGVAVDGGGNVYIADSNSHRVRRIGADGVIQTVAGNGTPAFGGDGGPATLASLANPQAVCLDAAGNLYIADTNNHRVRKVTPGGFISTVAGNGSQSYGGDGWLAVAAGLALPGGVAADQQGNLYIADSFNHRVRKVTPDGMIATVAGSGARGFSGDGAPAVTAALNDPRGVAADAQGGLLIADTGNNMLRVVRPGGTITTLAGLGSTPGDGGLALTAGLAGPLGAAASPQGGIFVADTGNGRIRKLTPLVCTVTFDAAGADFGGTGGAGRIAVAGAHALCPLAAASDAAWLTLTAGASGLGSGLVEYAVAVNRTLESRTGRITVNGQVYTVTQAAPHYGVATVSAASWQGPRVAPDMLLTSLGTPLTSRTEVAADEWPLELGNLTVQVYDSRGNEGFARIYYASPNQVNWLLPGWLADGPARVIVRNGREGGEFKGTIEVQRTAPGLFAANATGTGAAAAAAVTIGADGAQTPVPALLCGTAAGSCVAQHLDPRTGDVIVLLFGTGIRGYSSLSAASAGRPLEITGAAPQSEYAGLDQVNVRIPQTLAGAGEIPVTVKVDGVESNVVTVAMGPAPIKVSRLSPSVVKQGRMAALTVSGDGLGFAKGIRFYPADGITPSGFTPGLAQATATLLVAQGAALGRRTMIVESAAGRSDAVAFDVSQAGPDIANLETGIWPGATQCTTPSGPCFPYYQWTFDFVSDIAGITFDPDATTGVARAKVQVVAGRNICTVLDGPHNGLNQAGKTSGKITLTAVSPLLTPGVQAGAGGEYQVTVIDNLGNPSNTLAAPSPFTCVK